jgi:hypothetical protein
MIVNFEYLACAFAGGLVPNIITQLNLADLPESKLFDSWRTINFWIAIVLLSLTGAFLVFIQLRVGFVFNDITAFQVGAASPAIILGYVTMNKPQSTLSPDVIG